tara:strand:+ start:211 stop:405 length:195 start_codon:yes stop_codon:yes gene_type:complete
MYIYLHILAYLLLCVCEIDKQRRKKMIGVKVLNLLEPIGPIVGMVNMMLVGWAINLILKVVGLA